MFHNQGKIICGLIFFLHQIVQGENVEMTFLVNPGPLTLSLMDDVSAKMNSEFDCLVHVEQGPIGVKKGRAKVVGLSKVRFHYTTMSSIPVSS